MAGGDPGMDPGVRLQVQTLKAGRLSVMLSGMTELCHLLWTPSLSQEVFLGHSPLYHCRGKTSFHSWWFCGSSLSSVCLCVHVHARGCTYLCLHTWWDEGDTRCAPLSFLILFFETGYLC